MDPNLEAAIQLGELVCSEPDRGARKQREGEKGLLRAILELAVADYRLKENKRLGKTKKEYARDAERWFFEGEEGEWHFGFQTVCDGLGLDADAIRRGLKCRA